MFAGTHPIFDFRRIFATLAIRIVGGKKQFSRQADGFIRH